MLPDDQVAEVEMSFDSMLMETIECAESAARIADRPRG
jgi:hypothetical protein